MALILAIHPTDSACRSRATLCGVNYHGERGRFICRVSMLSLQGYKSKGKSKSKKERSYLVYPNGISNSKCAFLLFNNSKEQN